MRSCKLCHLPRQQKTELLLSVRGCSDIGLHELQSAIETLCANCLRRFTNCFKSRRANKNTRRWTNFAKEDWITSNEISQGAFTFWLSEQLKEHAKAINIGTPIGYCQVVTMLTGEVCGDQTTEFVRGRAICLWHRRQFERCPDCYRRKLRYFAAIQIEDPEKKFCMLNTNLRELFPIPEHHYELVKRWVSDQGYELHSSRGIDFQKNRPIPILDLSGCEPAIL